MQTKRNVGLWSDPEIKLLEPFEQKSTMRRLFITKYTLTLVCTAVLSAGCERSTVTRDDPDQPKPTRTTASSHAVTYVYECTDGSTFVTRIEGEAAWLFLPTETVSLRHVPSGSGGKYSDGEITFWTKDEEAMLEVEVGTRRECRNNRAKAIWEDAKFRGADFRVGGNEPGWNLEIAKGGEIVYVGDYGQTEYRFRTPEPVEDRDARRTTYKAGDGEHELVIVLEGRRCRDTMSGEEFETRVTVVLDGRELRGCGIALH